MIIKNACQVQGIISAIQLHNFIKICYIRATMTIIVQLLQQAPLYCYILPVIWILMMTMIIRLEIAPGFALLWGAAKIVLSLNLR